MTTPSDDDLIPLEPEAQQRSIARRPTQRTSRPIEAAGTCPACGHDLRGLRPGSRCPECGTQAGDSATRRGPQLMLHAGRPVVMRAILVVLPATLTALLAILLLAGVGIGARIDARSAFLFPMALVPLGATSVFLALPRLQSPADRGPRQTLVNVVLLLSGPLLIAHALVVTQGLLAAAAPTPMSAAKDAILTLSTLVFAILAVVFFVACAAKLRGLEYWVSGDNDGSLFTGFVGWFVLGPLLVLGLLHAVVYALGTPVFRLAWRVDRVVVVLASIDLAFRLVRILRYLIHTHRLAGEYLSRQERLEEHRRGRH